MVYTHADKALICRRQKKIFDLKKKKPWNPNTQNWQCPLSTLKHSTVLPTTPLLRLSVFHKEIDKSSKKAGHPPSRPTPEVIQLGGGGAGMKGQVSGPHIISSMTQQHFGKCHVIKGTGPSVNRVTDICIRTAVSC